MRYPFAIIACVAFIGTRVPAGAQLQPLDDEFLVNSANANDQYDPEMAVDADGNFIAVWSEHGSDIHGRRYDGDGVPVDIEFEVNTSAYDLARYPALAVSPSGAFTVVWNGYVDVNLERGVLGRRYDSGGTAVGTEFMVNSSPTDAVYGSAIAAGSSSALVVWAHGDQIDGRLLDSSGVPQGTAFAIGSTTLVAVNAPDVAVDADGNFLVVWTHVLEFDDPNFHADIAGQRVTSTGSLVGTEFRVNANAGGYQYQPAIAGDGGGGFVVVWATYRGAYNTTMEAQRVNTLGDPVGEEFKVSTGGEYAFQPDVATEPGGGFVIAWAEECGYYCYDEPFARRYTSTGSPLGDAVMLRNESEFRQRDPAVAINPDGRVMAAWHNEIPEDVYGRIFATSLTTPICTDGVLGADVKLKLGKLDAPAGDEKAVFKGKLGFLPGDPAVFDPATQGAQILIEDAGAGNAVLFELSHATVPVPGGPGCGPDDGWSVNTAGTTYKYKNKSGALPPGCAPGSANGLQAIKLKDKRATRQQILFTIKVKNGTIPGSVVGPLRATLVTAADAGAGVAGDCGGIVNSNCTISPDKVQCEVD